MQRFSSYIKKTLTSFFYHHSEWLEGETLWNKENNQQVILIDLSKSDEMSVFGDKEEKTDGRQHLELELIRLSHYMDTGGVVKKFQNKTHVLPYSNKGGMIRSRFGFPSIN